MDKHPDRFADMSYIQKALTENEKLLFQTRVHWIYVIEGIFWGVIPVIFGVILQFIIFFYTNPTSQVYPELLEGLYINWWLTPVMLVFVFIGLLLFSAFFSIYISHEIGLTTQRIIHKKGLFFIQIEEFDLEDIRGEHVVHGWFGWLLGYGRVKLDCRFIKDVTMPAISHPHRMIKVCHKARKKGGKDDLEKILEGDASQKSDALSPQTLHKNIDKKSTENPETGNTKQQEHVRDMEDLAKTRKRANVKMKLRILKDVIKGSFKRAR
jgi:hypothetical protein